MRSPDKIASRCDALLRLASGCLILRLDSCANPHGSKTVVVHRGARSNSNTVHSWFITSVVKQPLDETVSVTARTTVCSPISRSYASAAQGHCKFSDFCFKGAEVVGGS
jgi:hypothetical protein